MTEDIKKYRVLMEQAYETSMQEDTHDGDMEHHMAQLLIDMHKDSDASKEDLQKELRTNLTSAFDNESIYKILDIAHNKLRSA